VRAKADVEDTLIYRTVPETEKQWEKNWKKHKNWKISAAKVTVENPSSKSWRRRKFSLVYTVKICGKGIGSRE